MCSRSCSYSSNALIVGALFLIIVEINQTNCNSILPPKPVVASGSVASLKFHSDNDSSGSSRSDEDSPVTTSSAAPPVVVVAPLPGSTVAPGGSGGASDLGGQIPLERLPSNTLLKYTAYKDVSILHFRIPTDTRTAFFSFKAYEESKSAFRKYIFGIFCKVPCISIKIQIFDGGAWYFSISYTFPIPSSGKQKHPSIDVPPELGC